MEKDVLPQNYNSQDLVAMWGDFIDWEKRREGEDNFWVNQLRKYRVKKVFDASLGDGCDSIFLLKQGFDVVSNEIDQTFLNKALHNAEGENVTLQITSLDWRKLNSEIAPGSFDAVILLGNSLTYLFHKEDQSEALYQFRRILKNGGILILDERNYQRILDNRDRILKGNFQYSGKYVYRGEKVHGKPVEISDDHVKMEYHDERTGKKGYLTMYPFIRGEIAALLKKSGFVSIEKFSDYKVENNYQADFYQYLCVK